MQDECCVYFIGDSYKHIKIGVSYDVGRRLRSLSSAHAEPLYLWGSIVCFNQHCAYCLESYFHDLFIVDRLNGEWFNEESVRKWLCLNFYMLIDYDITTLPIIDKEVEFSKFPEIHLQKLLYYGRLPNFVETVQKNEYAKDWSYKLRYSKYFIPAPDKIKTNERDKEACNVLEKVLITTKSEYRKSRRLI